MANLSGLASEVHPQFLVLPQDKGKTEALKLKPKPTLTRKNDSVWSRSTWSACKICVAPRVTTAANVRINIIMMMRFPLRSSRFKLI